MDEQIPPEVVIDQAAGSSILRIFGPAVIASLTASALGFVFWVVAARYYNPAELGREGPTISLATAIGIASSGGLYSVLVRVLPIHDRPRRLLWMASLGAAAMAGVAGAAAGLLHLSHSKVPLLVLFLLVASAAWSMFTMQDSILLGLRKTRVLFISNVGFGAAKLILLVVLAGERFGIVTSWLIPLLVVVPVVAYVADRTIKIQVKSTSTVMRVTRQHVAAEYLASIASVSVIGGVPVVAALVGGSRFGGFAFVGWTLFTATDMVSTWLSNVIVSSAAEKGHAVERAMFLSRTALIPVVAGMGVGAILAPQILMIYGSKYSADGSLLRLLMITLIIRVFFGLCLAGCRIRRQFWRVALAQGTVAVTVLIGSALASHQHSLLGVGIAAAAASVLGLAVAYVPGIASGILHRSRVVDVPGDGHVGDTAQKGTCAMTSILRRPMWLPAFTKKLSNLGDT
jgi:O-antigen/teichoic acid export membrane protein